METEQNSNVPNVGRKQEEDGFGPATGDDSSPSGQQKKKAVQELEEYAVTLVLISVLAADHDLLLA